MTVISYVKCLQDLCAAVINISYFFYFIEKKRKMHIGYFCITVYIEALFCVIIFT